MKKSLIAAVALSLGACAGRYDNRGTQVGLNVGYTDGHYGGYYGPFDDGYWGTDGAVWYSDYRTHAWHRDDGHHFQRDPGNGFAHVRGHGGPERPGMQNFPHHH